MVKFKIGDRVRAINTTSYAAQVGATATVTGPGCLGDAWVTVKWDRNGMDKNQMDGGYREAMFELIPANPLADLNVGDKFTLEFEVVGKSDRWLQTEPVGVPNKAHLFALHKGYQPGNIVRKPVEPAVGQLWQTNINSRIDRRIIAIAEGFVFYMVPNSTTPFYMTIETFKRYSTYVGPA